MFFEPAMFVKLPVATSCPPSSLLLPLSLCLPDTHISLDIFPLLGTVLCEPRRCCRCLCWNPRSGCEILRPAACWPPSKSFKSPVLLVLPLALDYSESSSLAASRLAGQSLDLNKTEPFVKVKQMGPVSTNHRVLIIELKSAL